MDCLTEAEKKWIKNQSTLNPKLHLEGQGDLVSTLTMGLIGVTIWVMGVLNPLTKSPFDPPSKPLNTAQPED